MKQPTPEQIEETLRLWKECKTSPYNLSQEVMETALRFMQKAMGEPSKDINRMGYALVEAEQILSIYKGREMAAYLFKENVGVPQTIIDELDETSLITKHNLCGFIYKAMRDQMLREVENNG